MGKSSANKIDINSQEYDSFDQLDGQHPWQQSVPEGFVLYPVRRLAKGKIGYFNFTLAKEMGLLAKNHEHTLNPKLKKKILDTFSLRIINEYDVQNNLKYRTNMVKDKKYMATRYLQLQHQNKKGETSGDGRCIWNGKFESKGKTWDVSSRGTGVTCLAPGAVTAGVPLESGNTDFGYGCGLAEIDELYSSVLMAEIMHNHGYNTERVLAIIDFEDGTGIGVRAAKNLFRPAHLFSFLKQGNWDALKRSTDFLIQRQVNNKEWDFSAKSIKKYQKMLTEVCENFAQFAAHLERDYIFAWLDWDGDNVLANAGIIDYGSIRQLGLRHDQYRYDDVERFSTNLNEQKAKARLIVQVFIQLVDFLETKEKKKLETFESHALLKQFDESFQYYLKDRFLFQVGLDRGQREEALRDYPEEVAKLFNCFESLEKIKTKNRPISVGDGVNRPAIFNVRSLLITFPEHLKLNDDFISLDNKDLFKTVLTEFAGYKDKQFSDGLKRKFHQLQEAYLKFMLAFFKNQPRKGLKSISERSLVVNRKDRVTGNGLIFIVDTLLKNKSLPLGEQQKIIDSFIKHQSARIASDMESFDPKLHVSRRSQRLMRQIIRLVEANSDSI